MSDIFTGLARVLRVDATPPPRPVFLRRPVPDAEPPKPKGPKYGVRAARRVPFRPHPMAGPHRPVQPVPIALLREVFERLEGRECHERRRAARTRDLALIVLLAHGMKADDIYDLEVTQLLAKSYPRPVWRALGAWLRRRAEIPGVVGRTHRIMVSTQGRLLVPLGVRGTLWRRFAGTEMPKPATQELRLTRPWAHLPAEVAPAWFRSLVRGDAVHTRIPRVTLPSEPAELEVLDAAREALGLPGFDESWPFGLARRYLLAEQPRQRRPDGWEHGVLERSRPLPHFTAP